MLTTAILDNSLSVATIADVICSMIGYHRTAELVVIIGLTLFPVN